LTLQSYILLMTAIDPVTGDASRKPLDEEIDAYGLTHPGKVRKTNEDHFLISSLHRNVKVHMTSLPNPESLSGDTGRLAFLAMVADGVGGAPHGSDASRWAVEASMHYLMQSLHCYYNADSTNEATFTQALQETAIHCHRQLLERSAVDTTYDGMATTLTLWLGVWPRAYVLQVGDSRAYLLRGDELTQLSRDQTMAQVLVDQGVMSETDAVGTRWEHVLASSIGGPESMPVVTRMDQQWGDIGLLCSDGLTKHVSDEKIRKRLRKMTSARQACEALLQDALDDGGTDNITIIVGRKVGRGGS
jgi:protein phosphatase